MKTKPSKKLFAIIFIILILIVVILAFIFLLSYWKNLSHQYVEVEGIIVEVKLDGKSDKWYDNSICIENEKTKQAHVMERVYIRENTIIKDIHGKRTENITLQEGQLVRARVLNRVMYGGTWINPKTGESLPEEGTYECIEIIILEMND